MNLIMRLCRVCKKMTPHIIFHGDGCRAFSCKVCIKEHICPTGKLTAESSPVSLPPLA